MKKNKKNILILICVVILFFSSVVSSNSCRLKTQENPIDIFTSKYPELQIQYSLVADIDGDLIPDYFIVTGKENPKLWYIDKSGNGSVIVDGEGTEYLATEVVDRKNEKHVAFMGYYYPSNTQLWVVRLENDTPGIIFEIMADWEISVTSDGFNMVWKRYEDEGGYNLIEDKFIWDQNEGKYNKVEKAD